MQVIQYFQLVADAGLVMALLFLAVKFTRSSASFAQQKSEELYKALSALVKEAEQAGQNLNDRLVKRQNQLEKVLSELGVLEGRIEKLDSSTEEIIEKLESQQTSAQKLLNDLKSQITVSSQQRVGSTVVPTISTITKQVEQPVSIPAPSLNEEVAFEFEENDGVISAKDEKRDDLSHQPVKPALNIYGQPIVNSYTASAKLSSNIEKEVSANIPRNEVEALETVYDSAEKLLRAGADLPSVATKTKLPLDEVRMLSQIVSANRQEQDGQDAVKVDLKPARALTPESFERPQQVFSANEIQASRNDNRLGVLGEIKRQKLTV